MIGLDTSVFVQLEVKDAPKHSEARALLEREIIKAGQKVALAPQVLLEFLHIVTDQRRFPHPLPMHEARARAKLWMYAKEVQMIYPNAAANETLLEWMVQHRLGRKRIIDTHLAATFWTNGVLRILTSNPADFAIFEVFECISP